MIHEAVQWSEIRKQWVFLPRRLGKHKYDDVTDERRGTNVMITADAKFEDIKYVGLVLLHRYDDLPSEFPSSVH